MTRYPFGYTLAAITGVCAAFWLITMLYPIYAGAAAVFIAASCGVIWLVVKIRRFFEAGSRCAAKFVSGDEPAKPARPAPLVPYNVKDIGTGQFAPRQPILHAALRRDVEAK